MKRKLFTTLLAIAALFTCALALSACGGKEADTDQLTYTKIDGGYEVSRKDSVADIKKVIIPSTYENEPVISIGEKAFQHCTKLTSVTIPDSVTSIGRFAFYGCGLTEVSISDKVTSLDSDAFGYCENLATVTVSGSTEIGDRAFFNCDKLKSVTIPNASVSSTAFSSSGNIESLTASTSAIKYIPKSNLKTVVLTSGTTIDSTTFESCMSLTSITIPVSVTYIGSNNFAWCLNLKDVYYKGSEAKWSAITIGNNNNFLTKATIHYNS